ncbi:L-rhamnose mutarotase [Arthrobacter bambusae]|uniref:L-rhamnose mutarotase n=1 Tax=Arthrobacter TaxID=1663 RepID=UPI001F50925A|nr:MULTISPECIES: L-rhamnose mutarotase [Arthrobacter]MCI0143929.1 L-rhamnose mutarotase [Arthrobacter bambusae]UYY81891.1 L-rhamnose mutarotase [Arthrobacter sp. YA7-1]
MRACFRSSVKPSQIPEYRRRHAAVWPEMLRELKAAGWNNYSLFLADDGLLVGYVECDNFDAARARMALTEVNARWQAEMALLFEDDARSPDQGFVQLMEIFNLEDQLSGGKAKAVKRSRKPPSRPGPR